LQLQAQFAYTREEKIIHTQLGGVTTGCKAAPAKR
jgi:hypothetical protein